MRKKPKYKHLFKYCTSKTDTLHQEYIHKNLFCTILAKEKPIQRDNRYFLLNLRLISNLSQSLVWMTKLKLICKTLFMHSALEQ